LFHAKSHVFPVNISMQQMWLDILSNLPRLTSWSFATSWTSTSSNRL